MVFPLGILCLNQISQLILGYFGLRGKKKTFVFFKTSFFLSLFLIFSYCFYLARKQFFAWYFSFPANQLVPPYNEIWYFFHYSFTHFFMKYFISLLLSLAFFAFFSFWNKRHKGRFFEKEEFYIAALSIFVLPHPLCFIYLIAIFTIGIIGSLILKLTSSRVNELRFPFYYFWLPVAIVVFLAGKMI